MHNYRVYITNSFVVQAGDIDTAWDKAYDNLPYGADIDDVVQEDEDPYEG